MESISELRSVTCRMPVYSSLTLSPWPAGTQQSIVRASMRHQMTRLVLAYSSDFHRERETQYSVVAVHSRLWRMQSVCSTSSAKFSTVDSHCSALRRCLRVERTTAYTILY